MSKKQLCRAQHLKSFSIKSILLSRSQEISIFVIYKLNSKFVVKEFTVLSEGKELKSLRASRKNENSLIKEVGGWRIPPECTRDLEGERLSGLNGGDLSQNAQQWAEET